MQNGTTTVASFIAGLSDLQRGDLDRRYTTINRIDKALHRGWEEREGSGYRSRSSRDYDDDRRSSRSGGQGHGGWFGDPEGHSEAARRGWG